MIEKIIESSNSVKKILHHLMNILIISIIYLVFYLFYSPTCDYYYCLFINSLYFTSILNYFGLSNTYLLLSHNVVETIASHIMIIINLYAHSHSLTFIVYAHSLYLPMIYCLIPILEIIHIIHFISIILRYLISSMTHYFQCYLCILNHNLMISLSPFYLFSIHHLIKLFLLKLHQFFYQIFKSYFLLLCD